jgi:hypothetical protein
MKIRARGEKRAPALTGVDFAVKGSKSPVHGQKVPL